MIYVGSPGLYGVSGPTVCTIVPKVTTVHVEYSESYNIFNTTSNFAIVSPPITQSPAPLIGSLTIQMFVRAMAISQGIYTNSLDNTISALNTSMANLNSSNTVNEILVCLIALRPQAALTCLIGKLHQRCPGVYSNGKIHMPHRHKGVFENPHRCYVCTTPRRTTLLPLQMGHSPWTWLLPRMGLTG